MLSNPPLDEQPWTYLRFSKQFREIREDARQLGALSPLDELVQSFRIGLVRTVEAHRIVELNEDGHIPEGAVSCYGGRSIQRGAQLGEPVCAIRSDGLSADMLLCSGDMLVRAAALLSMIQVADEHHIGSGIPTSQLRSFCQQGSLHLDWGKCLALVREGVTYTAKHDNSPNAGNGSARVKHSIELLEKVDVADRGQITLRGDRP